MKVLENNSFINKNNGCVLAFGNFDGVHKGHRFLLDSAAKYAREHNLLFGVYTFSDSPKFAFAKGSVLTETQTRLSYLDHFCGPDFAYLERFGDVKDFEPCEFVDYIIEKFDCKAAFCGDNFCFGKGASGSSADLISLMQKNGRNAFVVDSVKDDGKVVSSTLIKSLIRDGDVEYAQKLLGTAYSFTSAVIHGAHLGHKLGFPTINQCIPAPLVCPKYGVYITVAVIDGVEYMGVTNVGIKPTVSTDDTPVAETYVIGFDGDVYGQQVSIYFYKMLREEKKFTSLDELKKNIAINVEQTKLFFEEKHETV